MRTCQLINEEIQFRAARSGDHLAAVREVEAEILRGAFHKPAMVKLAKHRRHEAAKLTRSAKACVVRMERATKEGRLSTCGVCGTKFPRTPYTFSPLARGHSACSGTCLETLIRREKKL